MAFPPVPFQEWFLRQTSAGNAALNAYVARVKADGGVVEAIGCVPLAVWDWAAPSFVGLLDLYPNAAAAYSLRKLRAAYSGSAVRVRKEVSSVSSETDIGFAADGSLDTVSLLAFASDADSGDVFVVTWYDQSLSNDATQSTAAAQPKIVSGGSLVTENGKPAIDFDGVNDLFVTTRLLTDNEWAIFNVSKIDAFPTGIFTICAQHTGATVINRTVPIQVSNPNSQQTFFNNGTTYSGTHSEVANLNQTLRASLAFDDDYYLSINGDLEQVISNKSLTPLNTDFTIGALGNGVNIFNGNMQELITYSSNQSTNRVAIETNINTFYSIYP